MKSGCLAGRGARFTTVGVQHIEVYARSPAPLPAVWRWLADAGSYASWSMLTRSDLEWEGVPAPDGVGAIRRLGRGGSVSREQVVVFEPPTHLGYTLLSGMPVIGYRADVHLSEDGSGTLIAWRSRFEPRVPGTGLLVRWFFQRVLTGFARRLARQAALGPVPVRPQLPDLANRPLP